MMTKSMSPLYQGLTRPPMLAGVALPFLVLNIMINLVIFLATLSWIPILCLLPLGHVVGVVATGIDCAWLSMMSLWMRLMFFRYQQKGECYEP